MAASGIDKKRVMEADIAKMIFAASQLSAQVVLKKLS